MGGQYFSLETVISGIYKQFSIRMMLSPNSTLDVRLDFSLPEWSLDYLPPNWNSNRMTAVIGRYRHVTDWATLQLVGVEYTTLDWYQRTLATSIQKHSVWYALQRWR